MRLRSRLYSNDVRQIDLDVNRTYRNHVMFRERYGVKQQSLFHVLAAYSMYNTEVGYCQGMSQIGGLCFKKAVTFEKSITLKSRYPHRFTFPQSLLMNQARCF